MSVKTKKRFKNLGKICGALLFTLLMFTNIKVAMMDDAEIQKTEFSLFGIEIKLVEPIYAEVVVGDATCEDFDCDIVGNKHCVRFLNKEGTYTDCWIYTDMGL